MSKKVKVCAIIQARMGSKRLKGKMLLPLRGSTVLGFVVRRVRAVNVLEKGLISEIIVATTKNREDDAIEAWCIKHKVKCFRGSSEDVLDRYYQCANRYSADWILRITGDTPCLEPFLIYGLLTKKPRKEYQALAVNSGGIVDGNDAELFSFDNLEQAHKKAKNPRDREHVSTFMRAPTEDLKDYGLPFNYKGIKYSLDTKTDYARIKKYVSFFHG